MDLYIQSPTSFVQTIGIVPSNLYLFIYFVTKLKINSSVGGYRKAFPNHQHLPLNIRWLAHN